MNYLQILENPTRITDNDVIALRREVFGDAVVLREEAEKIFQLNDTVEETCTSWDVFFVEAMLDFCLLQDEPQGYMSEENASWLMKQIMSDRVINSSNELELLVKVIEKANSVPSSLSTFALAQVKIAVLEGNGKLLNDMCLTPGVIGEDEASLIRRVIYGMGAEGRIAISKDEVEVLFDLNDATIQVQNHQSWRDVFVKAIAFYLMSGRQYQARTKEEAQHQEKWVNDTTSDVGGFLGKMFSGISSPFQDDMDDAWKRRNEEVAASSAENAPVDAGEAAWLMGRINKDGIFQENEKELLHYLKKECESIDPSLNEMLQKIA